MTSTAMRRKSGVGSRQDREVSCVGSCRVVYSFEGQVGRFEVSGGRVRPGECRRFFAEWIFRSQMMSNSNSCRPRHSSNNIYYILRIILCEVRCH